LSTKSTKKEKHRILFICYNHCLDGARLYYRQACSILERSENVEVFFLHDYSNNSLDSDFKNKKPLTKIVGIESLSYELKRTKYSHSLAQFTVKLYNKIKRKLHNLFSYFESVYRVIKIRPHVIQASDLREIPLTFFTGKLLGSKIIYDQHEDFFNYFFEYGGKNISGLIKACWYSLYELLFLRYFDKIYCTDEYLQQKFSKKLYGGKNITLLRNFANLQFVPNNIQRSYKKKDKLRLVYIGTVTKYRGVLETVKYLKKFNSKHTYYNITLNIYGRDLPLIKTLNLNDNVSYKGSQGYPELMSKLGSYDVGICLLRPLKKYMRNTPVKNFDYMAVGLPILTSNFGMCKKYVEESNSGICIDPLNYDEFESAILSMFDPKIREKYSKNGLTYCSRKGSFGEEAVTYLKEMLS
jgi:glycosyltransferase involved in cell wall biosynthesis